MKIRTLIALVAVANYITCNAADEPRSSITYEDASNWVADIDFPGNGGWVVVATGTGFELITLMSKRLSLREGKLVSVWLRTEHKSSQSSRLGGPDYKSSVTRMQFDCVAASSKNLSVSEYEKRNMDGQITTWTGEVEKMQWQPITPGTLGESWLNWACTNIKTPAPIKPSQTK